LMAIYLLRITKFNIMQCDITKHDHLLGDKEAKTILIIYEDYECEKSGKAYREIKTLVEYFKEIICVVYRNFPNKAIHPSGYLAALVAEAGALQNKFIQIHDTIFENQEYLEYGVGGILRLIEKKHNVSLQQLNDDMEKEELKKRINDDLESGANNNVRNTPALFFNGSIYNGAIKFNELAKATRQVDKSNSSTKPINNFIESPSYLKKSFDKIIPVTNKYLTHAK
jgi:protein-disulfide isomerase